MQARLIAVAIALSAMPAALRAHHSFVAQYDGDIPMIIEGTVSRVAWVNPHAYVYINVENDQGDLVEWALEGFPTTALRRQGFGRNDIQVGDRISAVGWLARDGAARLQAYELTFADGRTEILGPKSGKLPPGYVDPAIRQADDARREAEAGDP